MIFNFVNNNDNTRRRLIMKSYNPFKDCLFDSSVINIPEPHYSTKSKRYHYAGFTADMGWVLMMSRYSIANGQYMEFPNHWGHSEHSGWREMFEPITHNICLGTTMTHRHIDQHDTKMRHKVKFKDYYTGKHNNNTLHPNKEIIKYAMNGMSLTDDLSNMRALFKWTFKLRPNIRSYIDMNYNAKLPKRYASMHIRLGDKVGESGNKNDPKEGIKVPLKEYVKHIPDDIDTVFIATDDSRSIEKIQALIPNKRIVSYSTGTGFSISGYKPTLDDTVKLWAEMELLSKAEIFITNMQSNVAKTVHIMMSNGSRTINVMGGFECCNGNRYNNCFWNCI